MKRLDTTISTIARNTTSARNRAGKYIAKNTFKSFYIALGVFVLLIVSSHFLVQKPVETKVAPLPPKQVHVYTLSDDTSITATATIEKTGVTTVVALAGGVVQSVNLKEGSKVYKGQSIVSLSSNYQGGNAAGIQSALAKLGYDQTLATYDNQKAIIDKQKEIAEKVAANADEFRDKNPNKLKQDEALSNLQKDVTIKQLENGQTALDFGKEMSRLQYQLASVQAGAMRPASPFSGTIQKIYVRKGQFVSPGTPIATVSSYAKNSTIKASVYVTKEIAEQLSATKPSTLMIGQKTVQLTPYFVSTEPVEGKLFGVFFAVPAKEAAGISDETTITAKLALEALKGAGNTTYIPLDGVYQTSNEALVYIIKDKKAVSKKVELGPIYGSYVEVTQGLSTGDMIILDRTVVDKQPVTLWQN